MKGPKDPSIEDSSITDASDITVEDQSLSFYQDENDFGGTLGSIERILNSDQKEDIEDDEENEEESRYESIILEAAFEECEKEIIIDVYDQNLREKLSFYLRKQEIIQENEAQNYEPDAMENLFVIRSKDSDLETLLSYTQASILKSFIDSFLLGEAKKYAYDFILLHKEGKDLVTMEVSDVRIFKLYQRSSQSLTDLNFEIYFEGKKYILNSAQLELLAQMHAKITLLQTEAKKLPKPEELFENVVVENSFRGTLNAKNDFQNLVEELRFEFEQVSESINSGSSISEEDLERIERVETEAQEVKDSTTALAKRVDEEVLPSIKSVQESQTLLARTIDGYQKILPPEEVKNLKSIADFLHQLYTDPQNLALPPAIGAFVDQFKKQLEERDKATEQRLLANQERSTDKLRGEFQSQLATFRRDLDAANKKLSFKEKMLESPVRSILLVGALLTIFGVGIMKVVNDKGEVRYSQLENNEAELKQVLELPVYLDEVTQKLKFNEQNLPHNLRGYKFNVVNLTEQDNKFLPTISVQNNNDAPVYYQLRMPVGISELREMESAQFIRCQNSNCN